MISAEELAQIRADQETFLPDTCTIKREDATPTFNEATGQYTSDPDVTLYSGACRVAPMDVQTRNVVFGEASTDLLLYIATLPYDAPTVEKDDILTVTASNDDQLEGRRLEVHSVLVGSLRTARRIVLQEVR